VLAAEAHPGLVAVAHEGQGVDGAEQMVGLASPGVVRRDLDVLGADRDRRGRPRRERGLRRVATGERAAGQGPVHRHRDAAGARPGRRCRDAPAQHHGLTQEVAHEGGGGPLVERSRRADLLHAPPVHDREAVGKAQRLDLVVGDEQHRDAEPALQQLDLHAHLLAQLRVQVAEGLVEQQEVRLVDERPAEGQALHLPAAQHRARAALGAAQAHQVEHAGHLVPHRRLREAPELERVGDVLEHGHVRPDRVGLEDHPEVALVGRHEVPPGRGRHHPIAQGDLARVGLLEAGHEPQRGGLAAAAGAEQGEDLAAPDRQRNGIHRRRLAEPLADAVEREDRLADAGRLRSHCQIRWRSAT
jgi:hypothetical protein